MSRAPRRRVGLIDSAGVSEAVCFFCAAVGAVEGWRLFRLMRPVVLQRHDRPDSACGWGWIQVGPGDVALCSQCMALAASNRVRALVDQSRPSAVDDLHVSEDAVPMALRLLGALGAGVSPAEWAGGVRR